MSSEGNTWGGFLGTLKQCLFSQIYICLKFNEGESYTLCERQYGNNDMCYCFVKDNFLIKILLEIMLLLRCLKYWIFYPAIKVILFYDFVFRPK